MSPIPGFEIACTDPDVAASRSPQGSSPVAEGSLVATGSSSLATIPPFVPYERRHSLPSIQLPPPASALAVDALRAINWDSVLQTLADEIEAVRASCSMSLLDGPLSQTNLEAFSVREIQETLETHSPRLWTLIQGLVQGPSVEPASKASIRLKATISEALMLKHRDPRANGLQLLTTFMLIAKGTNKEVITNMNHMGICLSYKQAWRRLKIIASDQTRVQRLAEKPLMWVYDNLNVFRGVHHERSG